MDFWCLEVAAGWLNLRAWACPARVPHCSSVRMQADLHAKHLKRYSAQQFAQHAQGEACSLECRKQRARGRRAPCLPHLP